MASRDDGLVHATVNSKGGYTCTNESTKALNSPAPRPIQGMQRRGTTGRIGLRGRQPRHDLPATLIGEAIAHGPQVVADGGPFRAADDADSLDREDGEEEVLVGAVVPVLVHLGEN